MRGWERHGGIFERRMTVFGAVKSENGSDKDFFFLFALFYELFENFI